MPHPITVSVIPIIDMIGKTGGSNESAGFPTHWQTKPERVHFIVTCRRQPSGRTTLPETGRFRAFCLFYLSKPPSDRLIYRTIRRRQVKSILELGIGIGQRAARMIEVASLCHPTEQIRFHGIDPFEARSAADGPGVTLKMAHRLLTSTGARIHLVPGDPLAGLSRVANSIGRLDLIIVSQRVDRSSLAKAWFYVPRLMHDDTIVLRESARPAGRTVLQVVERAEIEDLAASAGRRAA